MEDTRSLAEWMKVVGGDIRATEIEQTTHMLTGRIGLSNVPCCGCHGRDFPSSLLSPCFVIKFQDNQF